MTYGMVLYLPYHRQGISKQPSRSSRKSGTLPLLVLNLTVTSDILDGPNPADTTFHDGKRRPRCMVCVLFIAM